MDVESPKHLERLRDQPEIKAVLLREDAAPTATEARFDRAPKNTLYWSPIEALAARILGAGRPEEVCDPIHLYGRQCWLLATALSLSPRAPYAIAVASAEGAPVETLLRLLRSVSEDYWQGSTFWK
ncbi:MAG: hypothetical protein ABI587_04330 [Gemmatimonadales bacterium]